MSFMRQWERHVLVWYAVEVTMSKFAPHVSRQLGRLG